MALTGNKGEWSEIYTLLKLLGEGKVYAGDQHMNKIQTHEQNSRFVLSHNNDSSPRKRG